MKFGFSLGMLIAIAVSFESPVHAQQSHDSKNGLVCANPTGKKAPAGVRFINCNDGSLVDTTTGLMWELKDTTCATGDLHCVNNSYAWTSSGTQRDGTLYTVFLAGLNTDTVPESTNGTGSPGGPACFANHCDWRIPNIAELQTIIDTNQATAPGCVVGVANGHPCIDVAAFDPPGYGTLDSLYWSDSLYGTHGVEYTAWGVYFQTAYASLAPVSVPAQARAVRGGQ